MIDKILVVGSGSIAKRHIDLAQRLRPKAEILCLSTRDVVGSWNGKTSSLAAFRSNGDSAEFVPQVAVICSPAPYHLSVATKLVELGCSLLVEKPISDSLHGIGDFLNLCKERRITLQIGYNLRFSTSLNEFRNSFNRGIVGRLFYVRCEVGQWLPSWRPEQDYRTTVSARRSLGGGVLLELSHEIDYLKWIFGPFEWVRTTLARTSTLDVDVEDTAHLTLGLDYSTRDSQPICMLSMDFVRHDATRSCIAFGEKGVLRWNGLSGEVAFLEVGQTEWQVLCSRGPDLDDTYAREWLDFLRCVEEGGKPRVTGMDSFETMRIIEAARRSSDLDCKIVLEKEQGMLDEIK